VRRLKEIARRDGKRVTQLVREAVEAFLSRETYGRSTFGFSPPRAKALRRIYPLFPGLHWDALTAISQETGKCKTDLVREAVDEYLRDSA